MLLTSLTTYSEQNIHIIIETNKVVTMVQWQHNTLTGWPYLWIVYSERVLHKRQRKLIDVIDRHVMIFLTTYFRTTPMANVNFTSLVTSLITCHHCVSFTVALVICKLQRIYTSLVGQQVFTSMMRIMQPVNRGLAYRIPCCRSQSGLFSASVVNVREAHEYMHAIQPCNAHLFCIVVTSWHCVLHHKLAIKDLNVLSLFKHVRRCISCGIQQLAFDDLSADLSRSSLLGLNFSEFWVI